MTDGGNPTPQDVVRPFVMTGGRTRAQRRDLRLESMLTTVPGLETAGLSPEARRLVAICAEPLSVAEASAELGLVVGVTMVIAADLVVDGLLELHQTDPVEIELDTLSRIMDRVRAL